MNLFTVDFGFALVQAGALNEKHIVNPVPICSAVGG